jgi:hypothetical protein
VQRLDLVTVYAGPGVSLQYDFSASRSSGLSGESGSTVLRRGALEDPDGLIVPWRHGTFNVPATEPALLRPAFIPVDFSMQGSFPGSVALQVRRVTRNAGIKGQLAYWMPREDTLPAKK